MRPIHAFKALTIVLVSFLVLSAAPASKTASVTPRAALSEPSMSPDGAQIAFVSGGDICTVPSTGGEARLLVAHPATESRPLYSPDGKYLAFTSTRTGNGDVYVLTFSTGELTRLTYDDALEPVEGWSPDSHYVYFSSSAHDVSGMNDIYRVSVEGGTPMAVSADRYVNEFFSAPAPDGKTVAFSAHGIANSQWWRHGRSHLDESEIWTVSDGPEPKYTKLVDAGAKDLWPMWSADGSTLYYMSDRSGAENIWSVASGAKKQITHFTDGRVLWPSIAHNGHTIVFERDFGIWKLDLASGKASEVPVHLVGVPASAGVEHEKFSDRISEFALSPDAKKLVFAVHGELFAASAKDGGDGIRLTHTEARESQVTWAPDSRRIVYVSDRDGRDHLYLYDFTKDAETQLTHGTAMDESPRWSPDGKLLGFLRDRSQLVVFNVADKTETVVASALQERWPGGGGTRVFDWSPDSKWLAFLSFGDRMFRNASVVPVTDGKAQPVSFLANVSSDTISWSPDGKYLLTETNQRTENGVVARIDLVPHTPRFREDQFRDLFKEQKPPVIERTITPEQKPADTEAAKDADKPKDAKEAETKPEDKKGPAARPTQVVVEGIRDRLSILPVGVDVDWQTISPDGKWMAVVASAAGEQNIYVYSLDELAKEPAVAKQVTSTPGRKSDVQFTPDSKEIYYLDRGHIASTPLETPKAKPIVVSAEMDVDFAQEKIEAFNEAWRYLQEGFFDSSMNGVNWKAVHDEMLPYA
ncbi:MAG: S41 family peptidase, partial [Terriglobales bacterium]